MLHILIMIRFLFVQTLPTVAERLMFTFSLGGVGSVTITHKPRRYCRKSYRVIEGGWSFTYHPQKVSGLMS